MIDIIVNILIFHAKSVFISTAAVATVSAPVKEAPKLYDFINYY